MFLATRGFLISALLTSALAKPVHPRASGGPHGGSLVPRQFTPLPNDATGGDICAEKYGFSNSDKSKQQRTWLKTGAALYLADYLFENGHENWLVNMDTDVFGPSSSLDCSSLDGSCPAPASEDCRPIFAKSPHPEYYWIQVAANRAFTAMNNLHEQAQNSFINMGFNVDKITSDLSLPMDSGGDSVLDFIGAAFSLGAGEAAAADSDLSAPTTLGAGVFSMIMSAASGGGEPDPEEAIDNQISTAFKLLEKGISDTLEGVFGQGNPLKIPQTIQSPKYPSGGDLSPVTGGVEPPFDSTLANAAINGFFADGQWFLSDVQSAMEPIMKHAMHRVTQGVVSAALKAQRIFVMVNTDVSESSCGHESHSGAWVTDTGDTPSEGQCFNLFTMNEGSNSGAGYYSTGSIEDELTDKLTDHHYKIDLTDLYKNAWQCALDHPHGNGKVDGYWVFDSDGMPPCFWNLGVVRGSYDSIASKIYPDGDVNTYKGT